MESYTIGLCTLKKHAIADNRHKSIEHNILRPRRIETIGEGINLNTDSKNILCQILKPYLRLMLEIIDNIYMLACAYMTKIITRQY
jgi:hypothetical protein